MCEIDSIVSLVPKKKKETSKLPSLFLKSEKQFPTNKSNSNPKSKISNKYNPIFSDNNKILFNKKNLSHQNTEKNKINQILNNDIKEKENITKKKSKNNIKVLSEKDFITEEEEPNTPLMSLQKVKKPNFLMKSDFIKHKSHTPQEKLYQNNLCPIYDFYKMDAELNANTSKNKENEKEQNNFRETSFTQYCNKFKTFSRMKSKEMYEAEQINSIKELEPENLISINDDENNFEYNKNFFEKNLGENTPVSLGDTFSPINDLFDENIFKNENNFNKSPHNYKQMNVNININNNQQNNNIHYHFPYIINNVNSGNTNNNYYFNNNNDINDNNKKEYLNENNNNEINNINFQINEQNYMNDYNNENINNILNIKQNTYKNNNNIFNQMNNNNGINNNYAINLENNNNNMQNNENKINQINMYLKPNLDFIKLNQIIQLKQNLDNYLSQYQEVNNNANYNKQFNTNFINKNLYKNKNFKNNNNNIRIFNNKNNINNNLNYIQMMPNYNSNYLNSNNNFQNFKQENMFFNNNNQFSNQSQQIYNNNYNPYPNNLINNSNFNNFNNNNFQNNLNIEQILSNMSKYELAEKCYIFSQYQNGCRYLQDYIAENSNDKDLINIFFEKILEHLRDLSKGQFSHYFVKKILILLDEAQILKLIQILSPVIEDISTNQYGTKVIQDLIEIIKTENEYFFLLKILTPYIKQLIIDLNGMQIVYKLITKHKNVKVIENIICTNIKEISLSKKGSNFLVKYFEFADEEATLNIKKCILLNLHDIITDQFGNYVIQSILIKNNSDIVKNFVEEIKNNIIYYSNNKFASNAVEKCFQSEDIKNDIIELFMKKEIFEKIILDKFGNYVVQKAIATGNDNQKKILIDLLISFIPKLKNKYFGQKLLYKIQFLYPNFFENYN